MTTFRVGASQYIVSGTVGELPAIYSHLSKYAVLHDDFGIGGAQDTTLVVSVGRSPSRFPELLVTQGFSPGPNGGFFPGALLVPENDLLFLGAGTRLLAYDLRRPRRLWEDEADIGFWGWCRHEDIVLMSAEIELAAWDVLGEKLWSTFVEPPWDYEVEGGRIKLDVMGRHSIFDLRAGPTIG